MTQTTGEKEGVFYGYSLYDLNKEKLITFDELLTGIRGEPGENGDIGPQGNQGPV